MSRGLSHQGFLIHVIIQGTLPTWQGPGFLIHVIIQGTLPTWQGLHTGEGGTWRKDKPEPSASCPPCEARPWLEADGDLP